MEGQFILGVQWYSGPGSQSLLLPYLKDDVMLLHRFTKSRAWGITNPDNFLKIIEKNRGIYEVITERKRKLYFDIDSEGKDTLKECIKEILNILPDAKLNISGNYPKNGENGKYSYHIIVSNYYANNSDEMKGVKEFCKQKEELGFDWKVYTKNRNMKCINQSKPNKPIQEYISGSSDLRDHCITVFFDNDCKNLEKYFEEFDTTPIVYNKTKPKRLLLPKDINIDINKTVDLKDIVTLIPNDYDHKISYTVGLYYLNIGETFETFWNWAKHKDNSETRKNKWLYNHWPQMVKLTQEGKNKATRNSILKILENTYPNITKEYYTRIFLDYSQVEIDKDIKRQYVQDTDISETTKVTYLTTAMGSGKTQAIVNYIKKKPLNSVVFINCRISLAENIRGRLPETFISYDDILKLLEIGKKNGIKNLNQKSKKSEIKKINTPYINHLITTPYSAHYIGNRKYDILIIDEFEMYQTAWISDSCHRENNYLNNWNKMNELILNAKKVIIMDAIPTKNAILLLAGLGIKENEIEIVGSSFKYEEQKIIEIPKIELFLNKMISILQENEKIYIFWPYKTEGTGKIKLNRLNANQLIDYLENILNRKLNFLIYNSDTNKGEQKEKLKFVNKEWVDKDIIIVNQSITIGVNFDVPDIFHSIFLADANFVSMRELVQTSRRIRKTKTNKLYYCNLGGYKKDTYYNGHFFCSQDKLLKDTRENIFNEYKAKSDVTIRSMFESNQMIFEINEEKIEKLPKAYKEYLKPDYLYEWNNIPEIDDPYAYEKLICDGAESFTDVLKIAKYQFRMMFKDIPEIKIRIFWSYRSIIKKIYNYLKLKDKPKWIEEILKQLKISKKIDISLKQNTKDEILKKFNFKDLNPSKKTDNWISCRVISTYFGTSVFYLDKKRHEYICDKKFYMLYSNCVKYCDLDIDISDVCMFFEEDVIISEDNESETKSESESDEEFFEQWCFT